MSDCTATNNKRLSKKTLPKFFFGVAMFQSANTTLHLLSYLGNLSCNDIINLAYFMAYIHTRVIGDDDTFLVRSINGYSI